MDRLQKSFTHLLEKEFTVEKLAARILVQKLERLGVSVDKEKRKEIEVQIKNAMSNDLSDSLTLDLDIEDFTLTGLSKLEINPEDYRNFEDYIDKTLKEGISRFIAEISNGLIEELQKQAPAFLKVQHEDISQFDGKVYDYWGSALDLLELVLAMTLEVGANFNKTYSQDAIKHNDYVFEALMRLHARGCQVGQEILTLLKHGFPDGAHARWRTLHELSITASFIHNHGITVAERYLLHAQVDTYKATLQYQKYCKALGYEPVSQSQIDALKKASDALTLRFGKNYKNDYGWAEPVLGKLKPTFFDIEENVGLDYVRPFFKMASNNVHAGSKGTQFRLSRSPIEPHVLPAGPSIFGLTDPGRNTASSINFLTAVALMHRSNIDSITYMKTIDSFAKQCQQAFHDADIRIKMKQTTFDTNTGVASDSTV